MENTPITDRRGVPIREGDWVIWLSSTYYYGVDVYQVADIGKRVRLVNTHGWIVPSNLIVVDSVPYVEGRNNTTTKGTND